MIHASHPTDEPVISNVADHKSPIHSWIGPGPVAGQWLFGSKFHCRVGKGTGRSRLFRRACFAPKSNSKEDVLHARVSFRLWSVSFTWQGTGRIDETEAGCNFSWWVVTKTSVGKGDGASAYGGVCLKMTSQRRT